MVLLVPCLTHRKDTFNCRDSTSFPTNVNSSDVVKSRIQNTTRVAGVTPKYNWTWPSIALVAKEEGVGALYKGFVPKVLRLGPGGGILLVVVSSQNLGHQSVEFPTDHNNPT